MDPTKKAWNDNLKMLRELLKKESTFENAINLFMDQHARVHASDVSGIECVTFEDKLWEDTDEVTFRRGQSKKGRTIAYGMWHSARIEDIAMNLLVADEEQIIDQGNWMKRMNSSIYDTGNALNIDEILEFSRTIDMQALRDYRKAVGKKTRKIVNSLIYKDLKINALESGLEKALALGAVVNDEKALWLIDFWRKKTVSGTLLMQATRHHFMHINESMEAKKIGLRARR
ncbi:DinB family protein [Wukongibacter baidiensis]|uniref:DinB family protein n=1 Tax=Wukongibacter baidiensis TaxID=1723361 RepID=UPI003D7F19C7